MLSSRTTRARLQGLARPSKASVVLPVQGLRQIIGGFELRDFYDGPRGATDDPTAQQGLLRRVVSDAGACAVQDRRADFSSPGP